MVSAIAATARDTPDAVGPHRDGDELAVLVQHLQVQRFRVLATELEYVANLDAAGELERSKPVGRRIAFACLSGLDRPVGREVAAAHEIEDVVATLVGAGDPSGVLDDAGPTR